MPLSKHKIVEVKSGYYRIKWPRLIGKNGKKAEHGYGYSHYIVMLKTDTGYTGWGLGICDRTLQLMLEGAMVSDVFSPEIGILHKGYLAADMALHDLVGNILGIPVSKMINPQSTMKSPCYDGAIYLNDLTQKGDMGVEAVLRDCRYDFAQGYTDFKVKIGRGTNWMEKEAGLQRDVDIIRQIRKEFPDSKILVDSNDTMDLKTITEFMDKVKDCDIYWIEEPFTENYNDYMALKEYLAKNSPHTLVADGEFDYDSDFVLDLAKKGAIDVLLMDPKSYGFTAWRKLLNECKGTNIKCSPHCWGTKVKTYAVAHLSAAFPDICPTIEGVLEDFEGIDAGGYELNNGILTIPQKAGFGMELEFAYPVEIVKPY